MKKKICMFLIMCIMGFNTVSYANFEMSAEELPSDTFVLIDAEMNNPTVDGIFNKIATTGESNSHPNMLMITVKGEKYITSTGTREKYDTPYPIKASGDHPSSPDCIWTGEYYFYRQSGIDGYWYNASKYASPLFLRDAEGNIVKKFGLATLHYKDSFGQHADKIGYLNGTYYAHLRGEWSGGKNLDEKVIKSTDFENWEVTDEEVPVHMGNIMVRGDEIALPNADFMPVLYEGTEELKMFYMLGDWTIHQDSELNFYFSNDNVYFLKVDYPSNLEQKYEIGKDKWALKGVYEYEDDIVIDLQQRMEGKVIRFRTKKDGIYQKLDEMKNAPYVQFNNSLIGFEQPPVIENGSTLVPMRFLFEQMGADVLWNQETQTATAMLDNTAVTFSIDNTEASVNNISTTMDVPARLINDQTMVPLRFLSEEMGFDVSWDADSRIATIE